MRNAGCLATDTGSTTSSHNDGASSHAVSGGLDVGETAGVGSAEGSGSGLGASVMEVSAAGPSAGTSSAISDRTSMLDPRGKPSGKGALDRLLRFGDLRRSPCRRPRIPTTLERRGHILYRRWIQWILHPLAIVDQGGCIQRDIGAHGWIEGRCIAIQCAGRGWLGCGVRNPAPTTLGDPGHLASPNHRGHRALQVQIYQDVPLHSFFSNRSGIRRDLPYRAPEHPMGPMLPPHSKTIISGSCIGCSIAAHLSNNRRALATYHRPSPPPFLRQSRGCLLPGFRPSLWVLTPHRGQLG